MPAALELGGGRRAVRISHPEKVLFPEDGLTKGELAEHYWRVADVMVPHVRDRPVSLLVFPKGVQVPGIFLKEIPKHFPDWVGRVTVPKRKGVTTYALANDPAALALMANQNMVTPHVWTSRADRPERPDRVVWDLDPHEEGQEFAVVLAAARDLGDLLRELGLEPFAMVTGSKGLHVVVPIRRDRGFEEVAAFADAVGEALVARRPDDLTTAFHKAERGGKVFVDTLRNRWAQTVVAPYAVRPTPHASVATPLDWEELADGALTPDRWTVRTIGERLDALGGDPWADIAGAARSIGPAARQLAASAG